MGPDDAPPDLTRREAVAAGAIAGATLAAAGWPARAGAAPVEHRLDFAALADGSGWPGWRAPGVANLRRAGGTGLLEAGTDVFPSDPRPVAFPPDLRFCEGEITADIARLGAGPGVVLRRTGPRAYYAAIVAGVVDVLPVPVGTLALVRRLGDHLDVLDARLAGVVTGPVRLTLTAAGCDPTRLTARLEPATGPAVEVTARDATPELQSPGDPGVLATARTLFPSDGAGPLPALGNVRLLPYGVQEGAALLSTPVGQALLNTIRERSTVALRAVVVRSPERPGVTLPSTVATTGAPARGGAMLRVATDVPARARIELSTDPRFRRSRTTRSRLTDDFDALLTKVDRLPAGSTVYWRPLLRRRKVDVVGPTRSFRVLPAAGSSERVRLVVASCASQFGPIFGHLADSRPDVFVWQGDLNYPDAHGPLAQTVSGYAGIWRDFLANPRIEELLARTCFAVQRDDHDYGVQDANSTNLPPWGLAPWESLMESRPYYRFSTGLAEVWVLNQRHFKSDPSLPDTREKTLLGPRQRSWLLRTLAASTAPFKVICTPCTLAPLPANARDGSWAAGFTSERDLLLDHIADRVTGTTLFVAGDTHWTMVYDRDGLFEVRPCPLGIPTPNDITLTQPNVAQDAARHPGVVYANDDHSHFARIDLSGDRRNARLELALVREDGAVAYRRTFTRPR